MRDEDAWRRTPMKERIMGTDTLVLTDVNLAEVAAQGVTLVDFWAERCPPCRAQGPIVDKVAEKFAGRAKVGKLDVDSNTKVATELRLMYIPTLVVLKDGKEVNRFTGLQQEEVLAFALEEALTEG